ncbi:angiotensin-converting enzyme [Nematostella vectensis]|uniref:angiotensin-converting enzyme n=1 Tax=Nematostella vectensis TaxID=45351 RepID=UPI0020775EB7|nr:angiotensin-converting enzyme [Nematostella vectensis]
MRILYIIFIITVSFEFSDGAIDPEEERNAKAFLDEHNRRAPFEYRNSELALWNYETNLTDFNQALKTQASLAFSMFTQSALVNASKFDANKLSEDTKRQIKLIAASASPKNPADIKRKSELNSQMDKIYSSGKVKDANGEMLSLNPDLYKILAESRDYERLLFVWKGWRDAVGPAIRPLYQQFVDISNKGAKENGWKDNGEYWRSSYEVENLERIAEGLYSDLKPLYQELHAYVRYKLSQQYSQVKSGDAIPAHLFGNMWAQSWANIYDLVEPYGNQSSLDVTRNMVKQGYTELRMVQLAESFFTSIGLDPLPQSFYNRSMIVKPKDRGVVCHASAWDFLISRDVRIKQCTTITHDYLVTTHHELGHIQYFLQYAHQPYEYRTGANPGFHEAVGDTLSLSVDTPAHLHRIGLLDAVSNNTESDINALMKMALSKVAFLPFGFLIDQWRWRVFRGEITPQNYNRKWWELRTKYQGIKPPVCRTENDFDPGAKYHIPANTPYIRYFVSYVIQFQFHKAACEAAGHTGPLHKCSIYNSTAAGGKLGAMLKLGKSKPWPQALKAMTGTEEMDVGPLTEYFKPLITWMKAQRAKHGYPIGWSNEGAYSDCNISMATTAGPAMASIVGSLLLAIASLLY